MTAVARDWLPLEAMAHDAVRAVMSNAIDEWSRHWFSGRRLSLTRLSARGKGAGAEAHWEAYGDGIALGAPKGASGAKLVHFALGPPPIGWVSTPADELLLEALGQEVRSDLADRLGHALGCDAGSLSGPVRDPLDPDGGVEAGLSEGAGPEVLLVAAPMRCLAPLVRRAITAARAARRGLPPLRRSLADIPVAVQLSLGGTRAPLRSVEDLGVGDVVVLDTLLSEDVRLGAARSAETFASARLNHADGWRELTVSGR